MRVRSILLVGVVALALGSGAAMASDSFATLGGVPAQSMTGPELDEVVGAASFELSPPQSAPGNSVCPIDCAKSITGRADGRSGNKGLDLAEHKPGRDNLNWTD